MNVAEWVVVVVDDNPDNLAVASFSLQHMGATVYTATQGKECLALLATLHPTFILLDLSMPILDGWETLKRIKAKKQTADIPVIALTAHNLAGDRERVIEAGFDGYLSKPFEVRTFTQAIKSILSA